MGVRESVEQGMPDETRLHDLVVHEKNPEKELPFDPERDISEVQWQEMLNFLPDYYNATQSHGSIDGWVATPEEFYCYLTQLKVLSPERVEKFVQEHKDTLGEINLQEAEKFWKKGAEHFKGPDPLDELEEIRDMAIELREGKIDSRIYYQKALTYGRQKDDYDFFAISAMEMRLRGFEKDEIGLNDDDWAKMKHELVNVYEDGMDGVDITKLAFAMKVLAAPEVKVTSTGGIEFVDERESSFKEEKPELPVRREF